MSDISKQGLAAWTAHQSQNYTVLSVMLHKDRSQCRLTNQAARGAVYRPILDHHGISLAALAQPEACAIKLKVHGLSEGAIAISEEHHTVACSTEDKPTASTSATVAATAVGIG
jgi:hypothetical protein